MKERPILFSGDMVRAILDGRKTQTRRPVKPQPWASCLIEEGIRGESPWVYSALTGHGPGYDVNEIRTPCKCPLGQPGDRLWVRETWGLMAHTDPTDWHRGSVAGASPDAIVPTYSVEHRANWRVENENAFWRPSIHMPRWASRITLEITRVWVERVQDITEDGAIKEGFDASLEHSGECNDEHCELLGGPYDCIGFSVTAKMGFRDVWQSIYGTWDANPWVWAVEFRRAK